MNGRPFVKGNTPWNKGKNTPLATRAKISATKKGKSPGFRGNHSEESKQKISAKLKGRTIWNKGIKCPQLSGENNGMWLKDRTLLKKEDCRNDSAYYNWRRQVWLRDNLKCKIANPDCKGKIEAHHILAWRDYPELRYQSNNGITLCQAHHPRKRAEEKRLSPYFQSLVSVSND